MSANEKRLAQDRPSGGVGHGGASGRWLVSYADFITLMFVVFLVLFSMARVDLAKFGKLKASLQGSSLGGGPVQPLPSGGNPVNTAAVMPGSDPGSSPGAPKELPNTPTVSAPAIVPVLSEKPDSAPAEVQSEPAPSPDKGSPVETAQPEPAAPPPPAEPAPDPMASVARVLSATAAARTGNVQVDLQARGVVVRILTSVLFADGSADLKPEAAQLLNDISRELKQTPESVLVEGSPDAGDAKAPWDLSSRRATNVVGYLVTQRGIDPSRFVVIGYGKSEQPEGFVNVVIIRRQN